MNLNKLIYQRMYHIACFIPDGIIHDKTDKNSSYNNDNIMFQEPFIKEIKEYINISEFEYKLFLVCIIIFRRLSELFGQLSDNSSYPDNPKLFFQYIKNSSDFSSKTLREQTHGAFQTLRSCVNFYCRFSRIYIIFSTFYQIAIYKDKISILRFIRSSFFTKMMNYPTPSEVESSYFASALGDRVKDFLDNCPDLQAERPVGKILSLVDSLMAEIYDMIDSILEKTKSDNDSCQNQEKYKLRGKKISEAKRSSQKKEIELRKKIKKELSKLVKKNSFQSKKAICEDYFHTHQDKMKTLNITSCRTLQNICSNSDPNKMRNAIKEMPYNLPKYYYPITTPVEDIWRKASAEINELFSSKFQPYPKTEP